MDILTLIWMSVISYHFDLCQSFSYHFVLYQSNSYYLNYRRIWSIPKLIKSSITSAHKLDHSKIYNCTAWWNSLKRWWLQLAIWNLKDLNIQMYPHIMVDTRLGWILNADNPSFLLLLCIRINDLFATDLVHYSNLLYVICKVA